MVERVGFHSNFGAFKRNRHSKTVTRLAITNEFPFNPTYESRKTRSGRMEEWKGGRSPTAPTLIVIPSEQTNKAIGFYGHRDSL